MAAVLDRNLAIERNGRLLLFGYLVNLGIAASCIGTLAYPFMHAGGLVRFDCIFKGVPGLPCPTCGYSSAIECLLGADPLHSFLHNPFWIFWVAFQLGMVYIGIRSVLAGRQILVSSRLILPIAVLIVLSWIAKFIVGPAYY